MDTTEEFNFEVPVVMVGNIDDLQKIMKCDLRVTKEATEKDKDAPNINTTSIYEEPMAKDMDCTIVAVVHEETIAKDKDTIVEAKTLACEKALPVDDTKIDKNNAGDAETLINEKQVTNKKHCAIVLETLTSKKNKPKDKNCTIVDPVNVESSPSSTQNRNSIHEICYVNNQTDSVEKCTEPTPIIIDVDSEKDNECTIIDNDNITKYSIENTSYGKNNCYDEIYKENKLLTDLIEKCLDMENSAGMLRVINRTMIPIYEDADAEYKKSAPFLKALTQTIINLDTAPDKRFSHIKSLTELLKANKARKRVSLVTIKNNINGKFSRIKNNFSMDDVPRKRKKNDVINLDDDDDAVPVDCNSDMDIQISDVGQVIEDQSSSLQVNDDVETNVEINDTDNDSDVHINEQSDKVTEEKDLNEDVILIDDENINSNKDNKTGTNSKNEKSYNKAKGDSQFPNSKQMLNANNVLAETIDLCDETDETGNSNKVFNPGDVSKTIRKLEEEIAMCNKIILQLDEAEVTDDDLESPYLKGEYYKQQAVSLYKELCRLTGSESVKRRKVKLTVAEGHHEGPVRSLEQFINDNIDENGNPPFPDLDDVVSCVKRANILYNIGWNKTRIDTEARALFIHYGRTVKKKRQMREWRHLMRYVKVEAPDPAAVDPTLEARLLENNVIAKRNEDDLIDRFVQMEKSKKYKRIRIEIDESEHDSDYGSTSPLRSVTNLRTMTSSAESDNIHNLRLNNYEQCSASGYLTNNLVMCSSLHVSAGTQSSEINEIGSENSLDVIRNVDSIPSYVTGMENNLEVIFSDEETLSVPDTHSDFDVISNIQVSATNLDKQHNVGDSEVKLTGVVNNYIHNLEAYVPRHVIFEVGTNLTQNTEANNIAGPCASSKVDELENLDAGSLQTDLNNVIVKKEHLDIPKMLEQLGDNFTATVIDIEDPFMVIEISDTSESEDESIQ